VIDDGDCDRAMELVASFQEGKSPNPVEGKTWRCGFGEENESRFTECWNCGKARPVF
jgi:hypothetical protein